MLALAAEVKANDDLIADRFETLLIDSTLEARVLPKVLPVLLVF
jgi:hypothetical protein